MSSTPLRPTRVEKGTPLSTPTSVPEGRDSQGRSVQVATGSSTPVRQVGGRGIAPTPEKRRGRRPPVFGINPSPSTPTPSLFPGELSSQVDQTFDERRLFQSYTHAGKPRSVVEQISSKDCGAAALLMIYSDLMREQPSLTVSEDFWKWSNSSYLLNAKTVSEGAKTHLNLTLKDTQLEQGKELETLKNLLAISNHSLIVSITHREISGHWIVIDVIDDEAIFLRDPQTGKAYRVPRDEMPQYFKFDSGIEHCLSVESIPNSSSSASAAAAARSSSPQLDAIAHRLSDLQFDPKNPRK